MRFRVLSLVSIKALLSACSAEKEAAEFIHSFITTGSRTLSESGTSSTLANEHDCGSNKVENNGGTITTQLNNLGSSDADMQIAFDVNFPIPDNVTNPNESHYKFVCTLSVRYAYTAQTVDDAVQVSFTGHGTVTECPTGECKYKDIKIDCTKLGEELAKACQ